MDTTWILIGTFIHLYMYGMEGRVNESMHRNRKHLAPCTLALGQLADHLPYFCYVLLCNIATVAVYFRSFHIAPQINKLVESK